MSRRKRDFRWVKWLVFLVLIVVAIVMVIVVKNTYFSEKVDEGNRGTTNTEEHKDKQSEEDVKDENKQQEDKAPQYEGESPNKSEVLTGVITYADVVDGELIIRVNINQFLQSGSCDLTISRNGVTYYSQSAAIQESVTTSTCDGYKIPITELPKGDLSVEINLSSEEKSGKITGRVRI